LSDDGYKLRAHNELFEVSTIQLNDIINKLIDIENDPYCEEIVNYVGTNLPGLMAIFLLMICKKNYISQGFPSKKV
jgi:hypothetical protein